MTTPKHNIIIDTIIHNQLAGNIKQASDLTDAVIAGLSAAGFAVVPQQATSEMLAAVVRPGYTPPPAHFAEAYQAMIAKWQEIIK
jgi:hypothetical protein